MPRVVVLPLSSVRLAKIQTDVLWNAQFEVSCLGLSYLEEAARVIVAKFFLHTPMKNGDLRPVFLDAYGYTPSECAQYTVHEEWRRRLMR